MSLNKLYDALENETNVSIMDKTSRKIKDEKNNILQKLQMEGGDLKKFHKKLKGYRYCSDLRDIQYGYYIRWIPLNKGNKIKLTNGGHLCDVLIIDEMIHVRCRNNFGGLMQFKFDESIIFQKISPQEKVILSVLDYLEKE